MTENIRNRKSIAAAFLDTETAFGQNSVRRPSIQIFKSKLSRTCSYLQSRSFRKSVERDVSASRSVQAGGAQGSIPGPILYFMYLYYAPAKEVGVDVALFADDAALSTSNIKCK